MSATPIDLISIAEMFAQNLQADADNDAVKRIVPGEILNGVKTVSASAIDLGEFLKDFLAKHGLAVVKAPR